MIKINLSRVMGEKRIKVSELSRMTGLNRVGLQKLYNGETSSISFETLEKVCIALDCEVSDLIEIKK